MPDETPASEITEVNAAGQEAPAAAAPPPSPAEAPQPPESVVAGAAIPPPAPPAPQEIPAAPAAPSAAVAAVPKVMPPEWPCTGYAGPQPWEADNPPTLTQNHLMLSSGSAGPEVVELAALLAHLGFGTTISSGQNPHAIYDTGVSEAVRAFCTAYGVQEDPSVRQARTEDTVGPWIWEALVRAVHKKLAAGQEA